MKRILLSSLMTLCTFLCVNAQYINTTTDYIAVGYGIDGYNGNYKKIDYINIYGNYGSISFYHSYTHPSDWMWRFTINNYQTPSKEAIKYHYKHKVWYEYNGTLEYYITDKDTESSLKRMLEVHGFPMVQPSKHRTEYGQTPCVKRTINVRICIAPYKHHPTEYLILFDNMKLAINLCYKHF